MMQNYWERRNGVKRVGFAVHEGRVGHNKKGPGRTPQQKQQRRRRGRSKK